jgi:hypothetical protein
MCVARKHCSGNNCDHLSPSSETASTLTAALCPDNVRTHSPFSQICCRQSFRPKLWLVPRMWSVSFRDAKIPEMHQSYIFKLHQKNASDLSTKFKLSLQRMMARLESFLEFLRAKTKDGQPFTMEDAYAYLDNRLLFDFARRCEVILASENQPCKNNACYEQHVLNKRETLGTATWYTG